MVVVVSDNSLNFLRRRFLRIISGTEICEIYVRFFSWVEIILAKYWSGRRRLYVSVPVVQGSWGGPFVQTYYQHSTWGD